ncbi:hypothetical protein COU20_01795 [Candidatus Kaiserbacteria bacterium CG10_big_fil_rev_8_21_14_0_10_59_10]|uniref:DNA polymerase III delta N-terminal domain-containing protein n=1 Tax=Candidatus Kaiserbacteria bacterium CG10_big_fil_rev_8_21_14_0_10_59_10 TaxID=1974612 RepID=A0A2H0U7X1_9BACT|nr:MAG: hypothetical protein COU20_01795 [Candidatus Kaiserbacteria bacterium CG10_big_fil_rev_8_21_14_0_10_59_10]
MLYFYSGTDREKARRAMMAEVERVAKKGKAALVRITDANAAEDVRAALAGGGMFGGERVLVFEGVLAGNGAREELLAALPELAASDERVFWYEEKPDADARKKIEKHAEKSARFDAPPAARDSAVFALANALQRGDKKALWLGLMREYAKGSAPEMVHGVLFWGAKQMFLKSGRNAAARGRAAALVAELAALPHEARRRGAELEYALERFVLSERVLQ